MDNAGPVHSIVLHNIPMYFPGLTVMAPITPGEYKSTWEYYMVHDDPMFVSEHRRCYPINYEMEDFDSDDSNIVLFGISDARINMLDAAEMLKKDGITVSIRHIFKLKPFDVEYYAKALEGKTYGLVIDNGFPICGTARDFAYQLMEKSRSKVFALSCKDEVKCFNETNKNATPSAEEIYNEVIKILGDNQ